MALADAKAFPDASLYASNIVRTFFLEFENSDWEKELSDFNNTDVEVPAKLTVDGKTLTGKELVKWKYQRYMQDYLACVQGVDDGVGKVLDYLDQTGLATNTVVIYSADNGWYLGDLGLTMGVDFDLNEWNARFCVTPEFPGGTWAYFVCISSNGAPVYPYNIGRQFYGTPTGANVTTLTEP